MKIRLCIPRNETVRPRSQFRHSCICERFIHSQDQSTYFAAAKLVDRSWEYINRSQIHELRNWERGRAVSFLGIFVSNSRTVSLQCTSFSIPIFLQPPLTHNLSDTSCPYSISHSLLYHLRRSEAVAMKTHCTTCTGKPGQL